MKHILFIALILTSASASAGIADKLDDMLGTGWGSFTTTPSASLTPNDIAGFDRQAYSFASLRMRTPVKSFNILSFSPPQLNYGCSGIDITLGSFSLISKDELIAMFRSIASNALSYGFGQAIHAMCPPCWSGMKSLQEDIQRLNGMARNSCAIAKAVVGKSGESLGNSMCSAMASVTSEDFADCKEDPSGQDSSFSDFANEFKQAIVAFGSDPDTQFVDGNIVYEIHNRLGIPTDALDSRLMRLLFGDENVKYAEVAASLIGTVIHIPDGDPRFNAEYVEPIIQDFSILIDPISEIKCGSGADSGSCQRFYTCGENTTATGAKYDCGKLVEKSIENNLAQNAQTSLGSILSDKFYTLFDKITGQNFDPTNLDQFEATILMHIDTHIARGLLLERTDDVLLKDMKETAADYASYLTYRMAESFLVSFVSSQTRILSQAEINIQNASDNLSKLHAKLGELADKAKDYRQEADEKMKELMQKQGYKNAYELYRNSITETMLSHAMGKR